MAINRTAASWAAGSNPNAAKYVTEIEGLWDGLQAAWDSYTPALTASTTNPTLGASSVTNGTFIRYGKTIFGEADIAFGTSGAAAGTGVYEISLPVAAAAISLTVFSIIGTGIFIDASGPLISAGAIRLQTTTTVRFLYHGATTGLSATAPVVPAINDRIHIQFTYQAA